MITYFNRLKVEEAKRMLTESTQSVTHIADSLGFREVKYFDAIFKKYTGTSPVTYRENVTKNKKQHEGGTV